MIPRLSNFTLLNPCTPIEYADEAGGVITHISADNKPTLPEIQDAKNFVAQAHGRVGNDADGYG